MVLRHPQLTTGLKVASGSSSRAVKVPGSSSPHALHMLQLLADAALSLLQEGMRT